MKVTMAIIILSIVNVVPVHQSQTQKTDGQFWHVDQSPKLKLIYFIQTITYV